MTRILPEVTSSIFNKGIIDELNKSDNHKICFLKSPAGYGKTTLLGKWLEDKNFNNIFWYSFKPVESLSSIFFRSFFGRLNNKIKSSKFESLYLKYTQASVTIEEVAILANSIDENLEMIFVLDDFQVLSSDVFKLLKSFIENTSHKVRFVIASRDIIPLEFSEFVIHNQIYFIDDGFSFGFNETKEFFMDKGINFKDDQIKQIIEYTNGWVPAYVSIAASYKMKRDKNDNHLDYLYEYFNQSILGSFDLDTKKILNIAYVLEEFSLSLVTKISKIDKDKITECFSKCEPFFIRCLGNEFKIIPVIKDFFDKNIDKRMYEMTCIEVADYFKSKKKIDLAVKFYYQGNDIEQMVKAIEIFSRNHNYTDFDEISDTIQKIDDSISSKYPVILLALIVDCFNKFNVEKNIYYFKKLLELSKIVSDKQYKDIDDMIHFLKFYDMGTNNKNVFKSLLLANEQKRQVASVDFCSYFPSVLRGIRDFSDIIPNLESDYKYKEAINNVLGQRGRYLYELAMAEIDLERGNFKSAIMKVNSIIYYQNVAIPTEVSFVGANILVRAYIALNKTEDAYNVIFKLKQKIMESDRLYLLPCFRAISLKYYIATSNNNIITDWMLGHANKDVYNIGFRELYIYKNKARILLFKNDYSKALILVEFLMSKCKLYDRFIDLAELYFMKAIIYNNNIDTMIESIIKSLDITMQYKYKTIYYEYGSQGIYTLESVIKLVDKKYQDYLKELLRNKHSYVSEILEVNNVIEIKKLSKQEFLILKLIEKGYSNDKICNELDIKLTTVKTYITRIFSKLDVKNRNQAVKIAKEMNIL